MNDPPATPESRSLLKKVSNKFKKAGKSFRKSFSKSKSDKAASSASSFDELDSAADRKQLETLRRSLSEGDYKSSSAAQARAAPLVGSVQEEQPVVASPCSEGTLQKSDSFEKMLKEKLVERRKVVLLEGARSSFSDEVNNSEGGSEGAGLITSTALPESGKCQLETHLSEEAPEEAEVGPVIRIETPKVEREPFSAMEDLKEKEDEPEDGSETQDEQLEIEVGELTGQAVEMSEECGESEVVLEKSDGEDVGFYDDEEKEVGVIDGDMGESEVILEKSDGEDVGLYDDEEKEVGVTDGDIGESEMSGTVGVVPDAELMEEVGHAQPSFEEETESVLGMDKEGRGLVVNEPEIEKSLGQAQLPKAPGSSQGLDSAKNEDSNTETAVATAPKTSTVGVVPADVQTQEFDLVVAAKSSSRDIALHDMEELKKLRNSCSQVDELRRDVVVHNERVRQSADVTRGQLEKCTTGHPSQDRVPRWRWVRKVAAPVTFVTGAVILKIVAN